MTDFFDWLTAADSGLGTDRLRERFRLSEDEMRRASEALAPAFILGLQRLAASPAAWGDFLHRMGTLGQAGAGATPASLLAELLGTRTLAQSVARQASMMAGIAPDTIAKMMPELGLMTVRTMMQMAGMPGVSPFGQTLPADAGGQAVAEVMRRSANAVEAFSRPSTQATAVPGMAFPNYLHQLFADALKGGFPWMNFPLLAPAPQPQKPDEKELSPFFAFSPLFAAFDTGKRAAEAKHAPADKAPADLADPLAGMARVLEASRAAQEAYARQIMALFDKYPPKTK